MPRRPTAGPCASSASRQVCGPTPQLTPIASTAGRGERRPRLLGLVPSGSARSSPNVSWATIGRSDALRASSIGEQQVAQVAERLEQQVDAALEQALDLLAEGGPDRRPRRGAAGRAIGGPSGPIDPPTSTSRPADVARLAGDLGGPAVEPPRLVGQAERREAEPVGAERRWSRSAPRRPRGTRGGSRRSGPGGSSASSSRQARCGTPRLNSSVPMAPSSEQRAHGRAVRQTALTCRSPRQPTRARRRVPAGGRERAGRPAPGGPAGDAAGRCTSRTATRRTRRPRAIATRSPRRSGGRRCSPSSSVDSQMGPSTRAGSSAGRTPSGDRALPTEVNATMSCRAP